MKNSYIYKNENVHFVNGFALIIHKTDHEQIKVLLNERENSY